MAKRKKHLYKVVCYLGGKKVGHTKYTDDARLAVREALFQPRNIVCVVFKLSYGKYKRVARYKGGKRVRLSKKAKAKQSMFVKRVRRRKKRSDTGRRKMSKKKSDAYRKSGRIANAGRRSMKFVGVDGYGKPVYV